MAQHGTTYTGYVLPSKQAQALAGQWPEVAALYGWVVRGYRATAADSTPYGA